MPRPPRILDADETELVVDGILATAGPGRVLVCGVGGEAIRRSLLRRGLHADYAVTLAAARDQVQQAGAYDIVIFWHALDAIEVGEAYLAMERMRTFTRRALLVRTDATERRSGSLGQKWMEHGAMLAGYRKHPLFLQITPYEGREVDTAEDFLLFEPIPAEILAAHPLESLAAERDLHMDMLREGGRRSDAHVERYRLALQFIRPGDTVLDAACGMGYGSRVLFTGSAAARVIGIDESASAVRYAEEVYGSAGRVEFRQADAQDLSFLPDASVDVVVSFETLEHLHDPERLLDEAKRVLRPGGRLVACIPNEWVDEHGVDPNPHHHHVYNWPKLREQVGRRFRIERAYRQIGGGGMTHTHAGRLLRGFDPHDAPGDAEWLIVVAMSDPVGAVGVPFTETTFGGYEELAGFHVARFDGDYDNPWLVKALVSIGFRFEDPRGLVEMARQVRERAEPGSADEGAALCVLGYAALEGHAPAADTPELREALSSYATRARKDAHALRWTISNLYVLGLLQLAEGALDAARASFTRVAGMDPASFSPLLATKTIGAAYQAGLLAALQGDLEEARRLWVGGVSAAHRLFAGDWTNVIGREDHPLYFGLPEVSLAVSKASKCAYALGAMGDLERRPGRFWVEVSRDLETQATRGTRTLRHTLSALAEASARAGMPGEGARPEMKALEQQAATMGEMNRLFELQAQNIATLTASLKQREQALIEQSTELLRQRESAEKQAAAMAGLQQALERQAEAGARLHAALAERDRALADQQEALTRHAGTISQLQGIVGDRDEALATQSRTLTEQQATFARQAENVARLNERVLACERDLEARVVEVTELRRQLALSESSRNAAAQEIERREAEAVDMRRRLAKVDEDLGESTQRLRRIETSRLYRLFGRWMGPRR